MNKEKQAMKTEEKQMKDAMNEQIVETQEESEEDDEITFTLLVDGKIVSWAKTLLYSYLKEIHTARKEKLDCIESLMTPDNKVMRKMCSEFGCCFSEGEQGMVKVEINLK